MPQSVAFTEKRTQKTESGIKDGFEKMELKFSVLNNFSISPGNFPLKRPKSHHFPFTFLEAFGNDNQPFDQDKLETMVM